MPVFGLGTWMIGGGRERNPENDDEADRESIRRAIERGLTHIDTAEMYAGGHAERILGEAIKVYDRAKLFLVSKVWPDNLNYDSLLRSAENSLSRLGTSYLDLYLIHMPNPQISLNETMRAMNELVDRGLVRHIGVSSFSVPRMEEALSFSRHPIVATQVHYNLIFREPEEKGVISYAERNGMLVIAWRPVQKGALSENPPKILREMCNKYGRTPAQVALNWLISQPSVVTLSTMRKISHLEENLGALGWTMEQEDIEKLRREFPGKQSVSDSVPLG